jgi:hypothetical protein
MGIDEVIRRIGFAEGWLRRAKGDYRRGQVVRGELTLSLAEAEIRHAWELSRALPRDGLYSQGLRSLLTMAALAGVLILVTAFLGAGLVPALPGTSPRGLAPTSPVGRPVITFPQSVGDLLRSVTLPEPSPEGTRDAPAKAMQTRGSGSVVPSGASRVKGVLPHGDAPRGSAEAPARPDLQGSGAPAPSPGVTREFVGRRSAASSGPSLAGTPVMAMEDLIDLVLTAERTLRGAP